VSEILKASQSLFDSIQAAFFLTDAHSKILYANRQAESFFGYKREELEGQRMRILFFEEDQIYFLPNILYLSLYKNGFDGEVLLKQKDGKKIFVHLFTSSIKEGEEMFLTFAFQEIQRLKSLEREKLEMERWASLGRMAEGIAHQFRNPVASVGGYANRLLKGLPSSSKSRSFVRQILREIARLETVLQRVEEYVQILRPVLRKEKIQDVVDETLQNFSQQAREEGVSFRLDTEGLKGDGHLFIDRGLLVKALSRILENSLEAIALARQKKKKSVRVSLSDDGEKVEVSVADQGQGIPTKDLSLIFEPFFSTRPNRVGLGLTYARRVMKEHKGKIRVESQLRKGTTVTLSLPKDRRRKVRRELLAPEAAARGES